MPIEIFDIKKSFGEKTVLKGIDFVFETGKVSMIIGSSGSGKTVLMKAIVGLMPPDSGRVLFDGMDFYKGDFATKKEIRENLGMLFQNSALFDSMTVEENVGFPLKMFSDKTPAEISKRVAFCLDRVNLAGTNKLLPSELSGGMKKRVGIARAISMNPKYLFVDEPNSGLDPLTASVVDKLILELTNEYNMTTIVVSHDMNSVMNIGYKILFIYKGDKAWEGSNKEILTSDNPALQEFIFVSDLIKRPDAS